MEYKIVNSGEAKPLADFCYGECFEATWVDAYGDEEMHLLMVVDSSKVEDFPQNMIAAIDLITAVPLSISDSHILVPVQAELITDEVLE